MSPLPEGKCLGLLSLHALAMLPLFAYAAAALASALSAMLLARPRTVGSFVCRALGRCLEPAPALVQPVALSPAPVVASSTAIYARTSSTIRASTAVPPSRACSELSTCALAVWSSYAVATRQPKIVPPRLVVAQGEPVASWDVAVLSVAALLIAVVLLCASELRRSR